MAKEYTIAEYRELIPVGIYRHFKGKYYGVIGVAIHSETGEPMVMYRALYGDHELYTRPASMWVETIDRDGYHGARFVLMSEIDLGFLIDKTCTIK